MKETCYLLLMWVRCSIILQQRVENNYYTRLFQYVLGDTYGLSSVVVMNIFKVTGNNCTKVRRNKTVYHFIKIYFFCDFPVLPVTSPNPSLYSEGVNKGTLKIPNGYQKAVNKGTLKIPNGYQKAVNQGTLKIPNGNQKAVNKGTLKSVKFEV